jgi:hypothetical protein
MLRHRMGHPRRAWSEELGCQCGAGMPCECQRAGGLQEAYVSKVIDQPSENKSVVSCFKISRAFFDQRVRKWLIQNFACASITIADRRRDRNAAKGPPRHLLRRWSSELVGLRRRSPTIRPFFRYGMRRARRRRGRAPLALGLRSDLESDQNFVPHGIVGFWSSRRSSASFFHVRASDFFMTSCIDSGASSIASASCCRAA